MLVTRTASNSFTLASDALQAIRDEFDSGATGEAETAATMRAILAETGEVLDPHTAVAVAVAQKNIGKSPMVTLATAHPAKFPDAVEKAIGLRPGLPQRFEHLMDAQESFTVLPNSVDAVKQHIKTRNPL